MLFAPVRGSVPVFDFPMSFPGYNPFAPSYSSPSTPQGFNWDAQDSVSTSVSTPQDIQAISPIVFQHHLSPVDSTPAATPHEPASAPLPPVYEAPRTIQLQVRSVPNHFRFDNIDESHFRNAEKEKRKPSSVVDVDEMRSSTSPSSTGAGPSRVPHGRAHAQSHPYRRPHTATSPVGSAPASGTQAQAVVVRSASSLPTSRRTSSSARRDVDGEPQALLGLRERTSQLRTGVTPFVVPAVGSGKAVSCPAMSVWRARTVASDRSDQQGQQGAEHSGREGVTNSSAQDPTSPTDTPALQATQLPTPHTNGAPVKRFGIRADVHFDASSNQMTVMLELPGLKKSDIHIVMNVCPYSRVRQLTISGRSRSPLPPGVYSFQERKFGDFSRVVALPMDTKVEDVVATMEDGILILTVPIGEPAPREDPQDIIVH